MCQKLSLFVHFCCHFSSENTPRLFELPSLYVKHNHLNGLCSKTWVRINDISLMSYRWNDKKAKMHYVLFCMPEISPCKLYLLRKGTDPNRYICVFEGVCVSLCV